MASCNFGVGCVSPDAAVRMGQDETRLSVSAAGAVGIFLLAGKYFKMDAVRTGNLTVISFVILYAVLLALVFWKNQKSEE